jgi:hypothetical protein
MPAWRRIARSAPPPRGRPRGRPGGTRCGTRPPPGARGPRAPPRRRARCRPAGRGVPSPRGLRRADERDPFQEPGLSGRGHDRDVDQERRVDPRLAEPRQPVGEPSAVEHGLGFEYRRARVQLLAQPGEVAVTRAGVRVAPREQVELTLSDPARQPDQVHHVEVVDGAGVGLVGELDLVPAQAEHVSHPEDASSGQIRLEGEAVAVAARHVGDRLEALGQRHGGRGPGRGPGAGARVVAELDEGESLLRNPQPPPELLAGDAAERAEARRQDEPSRSNRLGQTRRGGGGRRHLLDHGPLLGLEQDHYAPHRDLPRLPHFPLRAQGSPRASP